jgi:hypothetical protein
MPDLPVITPTFKIPNLIFAIFILDQIYGLPVGVSYKGNTVTCFERLAW